MLVHPNTFPMLSDALKLDAKDEKRDASKHAADKQPRSSAWPSEARPTARSAVPREARPAPKPPGAEGAPELLEGVKRKLECDPPGSVFCRGL